MFLKNKIILILLWLTPLAMVAQGISGTVVDMQSKQAIPFVNISIQGKATGVSTNDAGHFQIDVSGDNLKLVFSHINYKKQEITLSELITNAVIQLQPKANELGGIIVSASLYEQDLTTLTKSAAIISNRDIKDNFNSNMIDVLSSTPGITQVWEYHSPIILRGLSSKRLIMLKNGNRRIGTFPGGYFGQDMNIYDVKKIEIVKGPGSVIYGSGAISGIINVISCEPFGKDETKANFLSGYGSNNNEFLEAANLSYTKENYGIRINGKYRKTNDYVYGNGETAENTNVEDRDIAVATGVKLSEKHSLKLNADYHYGDWGKPRGFNGPTKKFTKIRNEENNFHSDVSYAYQSEDVLQDIKVSAYYDNDNRDYYKYKYSEVTGDLSTLDLVHYQAVYGGGQAYARLNVSDKSQLTVGADAYVFRFDSPTDLVDYYNETEGVKDGEDGSGQQAVGLFVRNETNLNSHLKLDVGVRYDYAEVVPSKNDTLHNNESRTALSGNIGTVYSVNQNTHISANVGRAFRMPTANEMFSETINCQGASVGNPDLNPEYSWNFDIGFRGNALQNKLKYDLALFYNMLDNFICKTPSDETDIDFTYKNTDALIFGGELTTSYRFDNVFKAGNSLYSNLGASYVYGIDQYVSDNEPLFGMPPFNLNLDLKYRGLLNKHWLTGYSVKLQGEYAAEQNRIASLNEGESAGPWGYEPSDDHLVFNVGLGLNCNTLPGHPKLRFTVKNLLDTNYQPFGSYVPAMGRNFKTTLLFAL